METFGVWRVCARDACLDGTFARSEMRSLADDDLQTIVNDGNLGLGHFCDFDGGLGGAAEWNGA